MSEALLRLEASRERLRSAMRPPPAGAAGPRAESLIGSWLQRLRELPLVGETIDAFTSWWSNHPLRPVSQVAGDATNAVARPIAQRHPLLLVLAAGLLGAALTWARPWRWIFGSALFAGLVPQLTTRLVSHLPIESWLTVLAGSLNRAAPPAAPPREVPEPAGAT